MLIVVSNTHHVLQIDVIEQLKIVLNVSNKFEDYAVFWGKLQS